MAMTGASGNCSRLRMLKLSISGLGIWVLGFLVLLSVYFYTYHRASSAELARTEKQLKELTELSERIANSKRRYRHEKQVVNDILRSCRSLRDLPIISHNRVIISQHQSILHAEKNIISGDYDEYLIFVPTGKHSLIVNAQWRNADTANNMEMPVQQLWEIPFQENSRFMLQIEDSPNFQHIRWLLDSDNPAFPSRLGVVSEGHRFEATIHFPKTGVMHPNEIYEDHMRSGSSEQFLVGIPVLRRSYKSVNQIGNVTLQLEFRIVSDGPVIIPATDYFKWFGPKRYLDRGQYALEGNEVPYTLPGVHGDED